MALAPDKSGHQHIFFVGRAIPAGRKTTLERIYRIAAPSRFPARKWNKTGPATRNTLSQPQWKSARQNHHRINGQHFGGRKRKAAGSCRHFPQPQVAKREQRQDYQRAERHLDAADGMHVIFGRHEAVEPRQDCHKNKTDDKH